jgi:hypothetical protein
MDATIFFFYFCIGIIPLVLGVVKRIPILLIIGGIVFLGLWAGVITTGITAQQITNRTVTSNFTYFPLYGSGSNQTINMTNITSSTEVFNYAQIKTSESWDTYLANICLGLGALGVTLGGSVFFGKLSLDY